MKFIEKHFAPILGTIILVTSLFSGCLPNANAQITPPYYNPANVKITGGTINGTTIGATTKAAGGFTTINTTGNIQSQLTTQENPVTLTQLTDSPTYGAISFNSSYTAAGIQGIFGSNSGTNLFLNAPTGHNIRQRINNTDVVVTSSTGVAVTGALSTTGTIGVGSGTAVLNASQQLVFGNVTSMSRNGGTGDLTLATNAGDVILSPAGGIQLPKTITTPGTTGAVTINKTTGRVNFAAAATSLVVTNSLATANSICHVTKATNDATMRLGACVAAAGNFTIYADVAPAAETAVNFTITN